MNGIIFTIFLLLVAVITSHNILGQEVDPPNKQMVAAVPEDATAKPKAGEKPETGSKDPVTPSTASDPAKDADDLNAALIKNPIDAEKIKEILSNRKCSERKSIQTEYDKKFTDLTLEKAIETYAKDLYQTLLKSCFYCNEELLAFFFFRASEDEGAHRSLERSIFMASESDELKEKFISYYETSEAYKKKVQDEVTRILGSDANILHLSETILKEKRLPEGSTEVKPPEEIAQALITEIPQWETKKGPELDKFLTTTPLSVVPKVLEVYKTLGEKQDLTKTLWDKYVIYFNYGRLNCEPDTYFAVVCHDAFGIESKLPETAPTYIEPLILVGLYENDKDKLSGVISKYVELYENKVLTDDIKALPAETTDDNFKNLMAAFFSSSGAASATPP